MNSTSKIDPSTLGWVKTEIDETLKQARLALESFAENSQDAGQLRFCVTYLHQVVGTLQMVELDGAALLARDTELLAEAVLNDKVQAAQPVFELLTRAVITLPDYLARLQMGQRDTPLRLLPLINELRAGYGGEAISELDLFNPDLSVRPPKAADAPDKTKISDDEFAANAKKARAAFQAALVAWLRDTNNKQHLNRMAEVVGTLERQANVGVIEQLLWVSSGLLSALVAGDLEPTNTRKRILARIEQQIKKLIGRTEKAALRSSSESLIKSILFELASIDSQDLKVVELKRAFELDALMGAGSADDIAIEDLPTPEVMESVARALGKEIETAQELLAAYFDTGREDVNSLAPLLSLLEKMASTLHMIGVPVLRAMVDRLMAVAQAVVERRLEADDAVSMQMAGALLLLENGARELHLSGAGWKRQVQDRIAALDALGGSDAEATLTGIEISDATLTDVEFKQLLRVVAAEIRVNLTKVEEALEAFAAHPDDVAHIEHTPQYLSQIQGALQILGQGRAADLTATTHRYIEDIQRGALAPNHGIFDALAVAVGTIEVYLEGLERDRPNIESLIDAALSELGETLGGETVHAQPGLTTPAAVDGLAQWLEHRDEATLAPLLAHLRAVMDAAQSRTLDNIEHIAAEMVNLLQIVREQPEQLTEEIVDTLRTSAEILAGMMREHELFAPQAPAAPVATPPSVNVAPAASVNAGMEDLDEEIMQIFIEDAKDVYQNIERALATWRDNPENKEALVELRRGYHTLKGSGRMVGASEIAELAWSVEHALNQVREGKLKPSPAMFQLLADVQAVVPDLIAHLEGVDAPPVDTDALRARAEALSQTQTVATPEQGDDEVAAPAAEAPPATASPAPPVSQRSPGPAVDPILLQIFTSEASGHLNTIRQFVGDGPGGLVTHNLLRAAHTLQGNARSLALPAMAAACSEMEKYLQGLELRQLPIDRAGLSHLQRIDEHVTELLNLLSAGAGMTPALHEGFAELARAFAADSEQAVADQHQHRIDADAADAADAEAALDFNAEPLLDFSVDDLPAPATPDLTAEQDLRDDAPVTPTFAPAAEAPAEPEITEQIDPELLEIFQEEATDILENIEESLTHWRNNAGDKASVHSLKRALHTLKGGARMSGAMTMGNISHNTESLLKQIEDGKISVSADLFDLFDEVHDALAAMLQRLQHGQRIDGSATTLNNKILERMGEKVPAPRAPAVAPAAPPSAETPAVRSDDADASPIAADINVPADDAFAAASNVMPFPSEPRQIGASDEAVAPVRPLAADAKLTGGRTAEDDEDEADTGADRKEKREHIKVRTALLNELVNYAGEVSISRSRMEQQIFGLREHLSELNGNVTRFREQVRELEIQSESQILYRADDQVASQHPDFDPLEFDRYSKLQQVSRSLAESVHDLSTLQSTLDNFVGEAETVLQQQARVNTELQEGLMRTRMINFSTQAARLRHIVRQTSRELNKRAELQIVGTEVEVDRNVLERMIGPFEHMIRNALDHGIEDEAERKRRKKPATGKITIHTSHEGSEIVIRFADDGAGLNVAAIRKKAVERGLTKANVNLSDEEVMQFILLPGFSTAEKVTHVSGRGVGMDVVHNEVKQLGGSITVDTQPGIGTTFIVRLPLTLSIAQALMIYVGEHLFAIPLNAVSNILEVPLEKLNQISMGEKALFHHGDQVYPFMNLSARLDLPALPRTGRKVPVLIGKSGTRQIAIQIDGLAGTREVVIKSLGPQLSEIKGLSGATILGDGSVVLILDLGGLWLTDEGLHLIRAQSQETAAPVVEERKRPIVMVVDDSLTVRKITSRHLQKRGMDVLVAKDGLDAWEQLREHVPDVMLVDIEMPRMDGYELTANVRGDARLKHIPIIMITSRAGNKHRDRAMNLGVNVYMSKPYQEDELMRNIDAMLAVAAE